MLSTNQTAINASQEAIREGNRAKAMQFLLEAAKQNPEDHRPWMMMVRLAPSEDVALAYLRFAENLNPTIPSIEKERAWINDTFNGSLSPDPKPENLTTPQPDPQLEKLVAPQLEDQLENLAVPQTEPKTKPRSRSWQRGLPKYVSLVYLVLLVGAELITTFWAPIWGMLLHGLILLGLIVHGALYSQGREQAFLLSLSFAPLIRLISFTTPLSSFSPIYWYAIVGMPLLLAAYALIRITKIKRKQFGFQWGKFFPQFMISLTGILLGYMEYLILRPEPLVAEFTWQVMLVPALILLIFTGFLEELVFRGVFQYFAIRHFGLWGFYYVALVFAALHIGYQSILDVVFVFLVALLFGYAARRTNSILGVTIAHGLTNIGLFLIFPFIL